MNTTKIAAVGASAGGLRALKEFFSTLPTVSDLAFVVVTHLPRDTPASLQPILSGVTKMKINVLHHKTIPQAGNVYILPGHLKADIKDGVITVAERRASEPIYNAIDEFLFSLAEDQKQDAVAVILSGMGKDGARGVQAIHKNGGTVMAQDPGSTKYRSMPEAAIDADDPDHIAVPTSLGQTLTLMRHSGPLDRTGG